MFATPIEPQESTSNTHPERALYTRAFYGTPFKYSGTIGFQNPTDIYVAKGQKGRKVTIEIKKLGGDFYEIALDSYPHSEKLYTISLEYEGLPPSANGDLYPDYTPGIAGFLGEHMPEIVRFLEGGGAEENLFVLSP